MTSVLPGVKIRKRSCPSVKVPDSRPHQGADDHRHAWHDKRGQGDGQHKRQGGCATGQDGQAGIQGEHFRAVVQLGTCSVALLVQILNALACGGAVALCQVVQRCQEVQASFISRLGQIGRASCRERVYVLV